MDGEKAQAICLTTHANQWLVRGERTRPEFPSRDSPSFRFVESLQFTCARRWFAPTRAGDPAEWLQQMQKRGIQRLWFLPEHPRHIQSDSTSVGERRVAAFLGGSNRWHILAVGARRAERWLGKWSPGNIDASDRRIWRVEYHGFPLASASSPKVSDIGTATSTLAAVLVETRDFAAQQGLGSWSTWFDGALAFRDADSPQPQYYPDMIPDAYPIAVRRLLSMAAKANVFGGMGSWNDVSFDASSAALRYYDLSARLYQAMLNGLAAAANSPPVRSE